MIDAHVGPRMSYDSTTGHWTFPETGKYLLHACFQTRMYWYFNNSNNYQQVQLEVSKDNFASGLNEGRYYAQNQMTKVGAGSIAYTWMQSIEHTLNIEDTSNDKFRFHFDKTWHNNSSNGNYIFASRS